MSANTLIIGSGDKAITLSNPKMTMAGWSWDGGTLRHATRMYITFTPAKAAEIVAAIAAQRAGTAIILTGAQVGALPEAERAAYQYEATVNDATGIYVKEIAGVYPTVTFAASDVTAQGRA